VCESQLVEFGMAVAVAAVWRRASFDWCGLVGCGGLGFGVGSMVGWRVGGGSSWSVSDQRNPSHFPAPTPTSGPPIHSPRTSTPTPPFNPNPNPNPNPPVCAARLQTAALHPVSMRRARLRVRRRGRMRSCLMFYWGLGLRVRWGGLD